MVDKAIDMQKLQSEAAAREAWLMEHIELCQEMAGKLVTDPEGSIEEREQLFLINKKLAENLWAEHTKRIKLMLQVQQESQARIAGILKEFEPGIDRCNKLIGSRWGPVKVFVELMRIRRKILKAAGGK